MPWVTLFQVVSFDLNAQLNAFMFKTDWILFMIFYFY